MQKTNIGACLLILVVISFSIDQARAVNWVDIRPHDCPSRVVTIDFRSGHVMDTHNSVCWGAWCVKSSADTLIDDCKCFSGSTCPVIEIRHLQCENDVAGSVPCYIRAAQTPSKNLDCVIGQEPGTFAFVDSPPNYGAKMPGISIQCPTDINLK